MSMKRLDVNYGGPEELAQSIRRDLALWGPVIKATGSAWIDAHGCAAPPAQRIGKDSR